MGRSRKTIYCYITAYEEKGIEGLARNASPSAPRKLTSTQEQELVQVIATKLPVDVGFPAKFNWTLAIVAAFIEREWHKTYTLRGVSTLLHDLGLSHTKLMYEEIDHLLFQDESMNRDYQTLQYTWFLKGKQRIIPTYGKHQGVKLIGTLDYEIGQILCVEEARS